MTESPRIAVVIPCHNEAMTMAKVVGDVRAALPKAAVYVFEKASIDPTAATARDADARVRASSKGRGHGVRSILPEVRADVLLGEGKNPGN